MDSGRVAWHRKYEYGQTIGRVVSDGASIFYGAGRVVQACSAETGKALWQKTLSGTLVAGLTIGGNRLYAPAGEHKLFCLDAPSGRIVWDYTVSLPIMMEPATDGSQVYFGGVDGCVRALEASSGRELWKVRVSSLKDDYATAPFWPPVIAGDKVVVSKRPAEKDEKNLIAFAAANGEICWSRQVSGAACRRM